MDSESMELAKKYLGKEVEVIIDRPLGSRHPEYPDCVYPINAGYVPNTTAPDGEELDVYYLGINKPIDKAAGVAVAVIHRLNDDDDKLVVVPAEVSFTNEEIEKLIEFQEKYFRHVIIREQIN